MKILNSKNDIQNINIQKISILNFVSLWTQQNASQNNVFLDVRSEREFSNQKLPLFTSASLLNNQQHALIGTIYKQQGADQALKEGFRLSQLHLEERLKLWKTLTQSKNVFIICLRGGLRSRIVAHYVQHLAHKCYQVEGGYKALRSFLLDQLKYLNKYTFYILTGKTGSGKTKLLNELKMEGVIDLEKLADHKGSSFGYYIDRKQPTQSSFENALLFELLKGRFSQDHPFYLLEDESHLIGHNFIPNPIKEKMRLSPVIYLDADIEVRSQRIFEEYILMPLKQGISKQALLEHGLMGLQKIAKRLGHKQFDLLKKSMVEAFYQSFIDKESHLKYIRKLLEVYYDKRYDFAFNKSKSSREVLFKGSFKDCKLWLNNNLTP